MTANRCTYGRIFILFALIFCIIFPLGGCSQASQPENQAIAIGLSVDLADSGGLTVGVLLPTIRAAGQDPEENAGSSKYEVYCATAHSFAEAITILRASLPLSLNLTQLKVVVFSQELAQNEDMQALVSDMYLTHRLYNAAYCVVSLARADDLLRAAGQHYPGARLSSAIVTSMENYIAQGGIPQTRFADFYYGFHSIYGSPVAIFGAVADGMHTTLTPPGRAGNALPGALPRTGGSQTEFSGTALFLGGHMVGTLSSLETAWMNYLRGETHDIAYSCDGVNISLSPERSVRVAIDTQADPMRISLRASFIVSGKCSLDILTSLIEADIASLIAKCQSLGADPFLFSQRAASQFPDIPAWTRYDYASRFPSAQIDIHVEVQTLTD